MGGPQQCAALPRGGRPAGGGDLDVSRLLPSRAISSRTTLGCRPHTAAPGSGAHSVPHETLLETKRAMSGDSAAQGGGSAMDRLKTALGLGGGGLGPQPKPVSTLKRQDSFPGRSAGRNAGPARVSPKGGAGAGRLATPPSSYTAAAPVVAAAPPPAADCQLCHKPLLATLAEICSTPSEVGIFEVAHNKPAGVSWKKVRPPCLSSRRLVLAASLHVRGSALLGSPTPACQGEAAPQAYV